MNLRAKAPKVADDIVLPVVGRIDYPASEYGYAMAFVYLADKIRRDEPSVDFET